MAGYGDSYGNELTRNVYNVVHELGHAYDYGHNYPSSAIPSSFAEERDRYLRPNGIDNHPGYGQFTQDNDYLNLQQNRDRTEGETYGDMFVAWVFDKWNTEPLNADYVTTAQGYMP